jgi:hypothetical protein
MGGDGILKLELPASMNNRAVEVVVVQALEDKAVDELGWPVGFFDRTYGALADDPIERPPQLPLETRDEIG